MKISAWLIGKQLRSSGVSSAKEEQNKKRSRMARKYFLDYYQGLRSLLTAKYCSSVFFMIMRETGYPVGRGGRLLLIGRKRGHIRVPVSSRACARIQTRVYKRKRKKTSWRSAGRVVCTSRCAIDATRTIERNEFVSTVLRKNATGWRRENRFRGLRLRYTPPRSVCFHAARIIGAIVSDCRLFDYYNFFF